MSTRTEDMRGFLEDLRLGVVARDPEGHEAGLPAEDAVKLVGLLAVGLAMVADAISEDAAATHRLADVIQVKYF